MTFEILDLRLFVTILVAFAFITGFQYLLRFRVVKLVEAAIRLVYTEKLYDRNLVEAAAAESLVKWRPILRSAYETSFAPNGVIEALVRVELEIDKRKGEENANRR